MSGSEDSSWGENRSTANESPQYPPARHGHHVRVGAFRGRRTADDTAIRVRVEEQLRETILLCWMC
jgi:hypothetical protein